MATLLQSQFENKIYNHESRKYGKHRKRDPSG
jgi:hypothetical protein